MGEGGEACGKVCKQLNELGHVIVRRFYENASVGHVRKCASLYSGLPEPARVLPSSFMYSLPWATCACTAHQWDGRDQTSHTGYNGKQMDCATAPIFSAFRPQTV